MAFLNWEAKYEFGIPEMDKQHKKWLEILNKFYDQVSSGDIKKNMGTMVDEALQYTKFHFSEEEKFMAKMNFGNIKEQQKMHKEIISTLEKFKSDLNSKKLITSTALTNELKNWFKMHILVEDMKYADHFRKMK
jgi:hemerythrin-like metal-binding protein